ncbi:2Fe-2S iron-sulfur cluster-binding protein [Nafulsella turpanensis]|uniref:2Fe-2S iron-sulfur cluster-binding protein n=1 Tax=Nafulsella turpanensis TaxID=1265690 RepID=UPI000348CD58|nr:2Fe-2S iron-sulfur cluster-binding protein [Nafulsella turpanensis]
MPRITIQNISNKTVEFKDSSKSVLKIFQENFIDWMHACGGKGRCTSCKMQVLSGAEQLSAPSAFEQKMQKAGRLQEGERLACQCKPAGPLLVRVPDQNKLPHITYTD